MSKIKAVGVIAAGIGAATLAPVTMGVSLVAVKPISIALAGYFWTKKDTPSFTSFSSKEKKPRKSRKQQKFDNHFEEGLKVGTAKTKAKFLSFLLEQKDRDLFWLITIKIGTHLAKCDGKITADEQKELNKMTLNYETNPTIPQVLKEKIKEIVNSEITFPEIVKDVEDFLEGKEEDFRRSCIDHLSSLIEFVIMADKELHPNEVLFLTQWNTQYNLANA